MCSFIENWYKDIEKTGFYQSVKKKTKLKVVPKFLDKGFSIQEIAESLELSKTVLLK